MFSVTGKTVVITGAASGIGRSGAVLFARAGARVVVGDRDGGRAQSTADEIVAAGGIAVPVEADVTVALDVQLLLDIAEHTFGQVNVVFANAGLSSRAESTLSLPEDEFDRVVAVNFKGAWLTARSAIPALQRAGGGSLIVTSSVMALKARPAFSGYGPAKAAAGHLVRTLALEFAPDNIRVNAIAPAGVETPMLQNFVGEDTDENRRAFLSGIPLGRSVSPDDVAYAAIYLASDEASFITGTTLSIDGGRTA